MSGARVFASPVSPPPPVPPPPVSLLLVTLLLVTLLLVTLGAVGCRTVEVRPAAPPPAPPAVVDAPAPLPTGAATATDAATDRAAATGPRTIGRCVEDRPIDALVRGALDGPCVLLLATIHGDEPAGTPLLRRMAALLERDPDLAHDKRVVLVPVANPDGFAARRRTNVNGVDLNRNFPAENFRPTARHGAAPLSEPESRALHELILREDPVRVVSIHQPTRQIDWDGDGEALARRMAELCPLPARRMGSRPGSLGSWVGLTLDRPILTVELRRGDERLSDDALWDRYGAALLSVFE